RGSAIRAIIGCTRNSRNEPAKIVATNRIRAGAGRSPARSAAVAIRPLTARQASAEMWPREPDIALRPFDYIRNMAAERVIGRKPRVREVEVRAANHSEPLHQPPAWRVGGDGEEDDASGLEIGPGPVQTGAGRLERIALAPGVLAQPPSDFDVAVHRPLEIVADPEA